jgi:hypothetical protein
MSKRAFILLVAIIGLLTLTVRWNSRRGVDTRFRPGRPLLSFDLSRVRQIVVATPEKTFSFARDDDAWIARSHHDYPADSSRIQGMLLKLLDLKSGQAITSNPDHYSRLGLSPEKKSSVTLENASGDIFAAIDLGRERETASRNTLTGGMFVRPHDGPTVYLVSDPPPLPDAETPWLETTLLALAESDIRTIRFLAADPPLSLLPASEKDGGERTFHLEGLQDGDREKTWQVRQAVNAFSDLHFAEVFPEGAPETAGRDFRPLVELSTGDGRTYRFSGSGSEDSFYCRIRVFAAPGDEKNDSPEKKTVEIDSAFSPWVYRLESWDAALFNKEYKDFVESGQTEDAETDGSAPTREETPPAGSSGTVPESDDDPAPPGKSADPLSETAPDAPPPEPSLD